MEAVSEAVVKLLASSGWTPLTEHPSVRQRRVSSPSGERWTLHVSVTRYEEEA